LIVVAAPAEARAVLAGFGCLHALPAPWTPVGLCDGFDFVLCGVGKANAAGGTAHAVARLAPARVLNLGICGALPHAQRLEIGQCVLATRCLLADEGIETQRGWIPLADAGFPGAIDSDWVLPAPGFNQMLGSMADRSGVIATVSTCSGSDGRAEEIARRCGGDGLAEAMEGGAVGLVAARHGIPFAELRVVSNRTGNRDSQGWDLPGALARLEHISRRLATELSSQKAAPADET